MLKADLVCLSVELNGEDEVVSTKWAWKIPLGEGTTSDSGKVFSTNLTYGGNKIVIEANEGDPGSGNGDVFSGGAIWHGGFVASAGDEISAGSLWLNLSWDYNDKCVKGVFSDHQESGGFSQDGILSRNIFVARAGGFTPTNSTKEMDSAPRETIHHGTWGDLPVDGPKMDSYCDHESGVKFQSLEWDDLEGETTECQVQQLHGFSDLENNTDAEEEDQLVVRRKDDAGGAEICYVNLSSLLSAEVQTDTDSPNTDLSSIQWTEDNGGQPVLQLFKFDDHLAVEAQDSDEVVVKRGDGVEYVQLSTIVVSGDTNQGNIGKSIETKEDVNGNKFHQLYKFDQGGLSSAFEPDVQLNSNRQSLLPDEYEFVLRKNGESGEIEYAKIELSAYGVELSADSDVGAQKSIDIDNDVIQLHDMDETGSEVSALVPHCLEEAQNPLSALDAEFVIRKGGAGGEIGYVSLELLQNKTPLDRNTYYSQKSLQYATIDNLSFLELNGFHSDVTSDVPVAVLSSDTKSLLPENWQFLTRHKDQAGYWQLGYTNLSAMISGTLSVDVDSDVVAQKSLEWAEDNGQEYLQLYGMDVDGESSEKVDLKLAKSNYYDLLPGDEEFVIRTGVGGQIIYKNLAVTLSAFTSGTAYEISGDANIGSLVTKSIETIEDSMLGEKYHQLYNFNRGQIIGCSTTVVFAEDDVTPMLPNGTSFVVRRPDGQGNTEIGYVELSATQSHERIDSSYGVSESLDYITHVVGSGCVPVLELHNFEYGCTTHETSASLSADTGAGLLYRKSSGCTYSLEYMDLNSIQEFTPDYIGDKNLQYPGSEYHWSIEKYWEGEPNNKPVFELYNFRNGGSEAGVTIHNDGDTYYWPQNAKSPSTRDYIVVKHVDASGNAQLDYKQLVVTMPNIPDYGSQIEDLEGRVVSYGYDLDEIFESLAGLSGEYWPQGGSNSNCYGSSIGDSNGTEVIDLDNCQLEGSWEVTTFLEVPTETVTNTLYVGHNGTSLLANGHVNIGTDLYVTTDISVDGDASIGGTLTIGCTTITTGGAHVAGTMSIDSGCTFLVGCSYLSDGTLCLGHTTLSEAQL